MMTETIKKLITLLGEGKVKFSKEYFEKYGIDWYKEIEPDPSAVVFPNNEEDLKKIVKVVHKEIRVKLNSFLKKNKNKKFIILDIPLLLENNINTKKDILIYVDSKKIDILKILKKRKNFNIKILNKFREIQLPLDYKKNRSHFIIKNKFTKKSVNTGIQKILKQIRK